MTKQGTTTEQREGDRARGTMTKQREDAKAGDDDIVERSRQSRGQ